MRVMSGPLHRGDTHGDEAAGTDVTSRGRWTGCRSGPPPNDPTGPQPRNGARHRGVMADRRSLSGSSGKAIPVLVERAVLDARPRTEDAARRHDRRAAA